ncbi:MAG TPA: cyclase family protein [Ilumatobacteraceae bacterium]
MTPLPSYRDLRKVNDLPSSWGLFDEGGPDYFGCLNLLTPEKLVAAARLVERGAVFALNWSADLPNPPLFGRSGYRHEVLDLSAGHDDVLHGWNTQSSTQWDGFRHIRNVPNGFYDGVPDADHGMHHWARRGIAGRAVLCDVGRWRAAQGRPLEYGESEVIEPDDVLAALDAQGSPLEAGDVLLMRTGWTEWYESSTEKSLREAISTRATLKAPGLPSGERTAEFLWDLHIAAIGADNPAVEVWPPGTGRDAQEVAELRANQPERMHEVFAHSLLLPMLGIPLGEMFDLSALAADCAADGRYACLFVSAPLNLPSGVASPPNALAIK